MKRKLFLLAALFVAGLAKADDVTIADVKVAPGKTAQVEISVNSDAPTYKGFQFDLILAEGLSPVLNDKGKPTSTRGENTADAEEYSMNSSVITSGARFTCYSNNSIAYAPGVVLKADIQASADAEIGTVYACKLSGIECNTVANVKTNFPDVTFNVTVVDPEDLYTVLDENSTTLPEATDGAVDIKVKRTIKGGQWSTICLPFAMTEAQTKAAFGDDVQFAGFVDYEAEYDASDNVTGLTINFESVDIAIEGGIYPNFPYLIKTSADISEFIVNSTIEPDEAAAIAEYDNGKPGRQRKVYGTLYGTLKAGAKVPESGLFISENMFWYSTGATAIKAFRGYFMLDDVLADASAGVKMYVGGKATKINEIQGDDNEVIYDLSGRRVEKATKGIYIINGKKVLK